MNKIFFNKKNRGVALYISVVITGVLLLVSYAIVNTAIKELGLSSITNDSQIAFYAADSGIECALFWDLTGGGGVYGTSAFATSSTQQISCNSDANNPSNSNISVGGGGFSNSTSTFTLTFLPKPYCVVVSVGKSYQGSNLKTRIEARGYNTCDPNDQRRLERAIEANY